jgi:hypothetical protein
VQNFKLDAECGCDSANCDRPDAKSLQVAAAQAFAKTREVLLPLRYFNFFSLLTFSPSALYFISPPQKQAGKANSPTTYSTMDYRPALSDPITELHWGSANALAAVRSATPQLSSTATPLDQSLLLTSFPGDEVRTVYFWPGSCRSRHESDTVTCKIGFVPFRLKKL